MKVARNKRSKGEVKVVKEEKSVAVMSKCVGTAKPTASSSLSETMNMALAAGAGPEQLEKILDMQLKWEANEAKKLYNAAMAKFKPPKILKDRPVSFQNKTGGKTEYSHATLANVTDSVRAALSEQGFTARWQTDQKDGAVHVTCILTHEGGHSESSKLCAAPDASGGKNSIQAIGSTVSYLQRYTLLAVTGLATSDMDNDGQGEEEIITEAQYSTIVDTLAATGKTEEEVAEWTAKVLSWAKCEELEKLPASKFDPLMKALRG